MGIICVEDIRCYAYHGCMDEEAVIGTDFSVTIVVDSDLSKSSKSDKIEDTVDYVSISTIVQEEMAIRSKLIEHVAKRILNRLMGELPRVDSAKIIVTKHNAPIKGDVLKVKVELEASTHL
jgi:dihydroneopterin aldolase